MSERRSSERGGSVVATGPCWCCEQMFAFHPQLVPSIVVGGMRRQLCRICVELVNRRRAELGVTPVDVPAGAYDDWPG